MAPTSISLTYPVDHGGEKITAVSMRRPKVRDQKVAAKSGDPIESETTLFANLCEVPPAVIDEMDLFDYTKLQKAFQDFLSGSPHPESSKKAS